MKEERTRKRRESSSRARDGSEGGSSHGRRGDSGPKKQRTSSKREPDDSERSTNLHLSIRNKRIRQQVYAKVLKKKKDLKSSLRRDRKERDARGEKVERKVPRTIESMRKPDDTVISKTDPEVQGEDNIDEFCDYFSGERRPKLMLLTAGAPSKAMVRFLKELLAILPNVYCYKRLQLKFKTIIKFAAEKGFTDILMLTASRSGAPNGLYICHLPNGPTSFFRLTSLKLAQELKDTAVTTTHDPEVILNNFDTRLGHRIGRQLASLFPQNPEFRGRRVIVFHNQRDFIFFRHHRYIFEKNGDKVRLQEIGPRFTLKLRFVQQGVFSTKQGDYEYVWRPDLQVCRKTFFI